MTMYEFSRIYGIRATAIAVGCPVDPNISVYIDPFAIAFHEIVTGKCDLVIIRTLPDGEEEKIPCSELILPRDIQMW